MSKTKFIPKNYFDGSINLLATRFLMEKLTTEGIYLFMRMCSLTGVDNRVPVLSNTAKGLSVGLSTKNHSVNERRIMGIINSLLKWGVIKIDRVIIVNPYVFSNSLVPDVVYEMFFDAEITKYCADEFENSKGIHMKSPLARLINPEKIYLIQFNSKTDSFLKIGVTSNSVYQRYRTTNIEPYTYETILLADHESPRIIERAIKGKFTRYIPEIDILRNNGSTEGFHVDDKEDIVAEITNLINNRDFS